MTAPARAARRRFYDEHLARRPRRARVAIDPWAAIDRAIARDPAQQTAERRAAAHGRAVAAAWRERRAAS